MLAGAAAQWISPPAVVAIAGLLGVVAAAVLAAEWARHRSLLTEPAGERRAPATAPGGPSLDTPGVSDQAEAI
jgi:hypothetical protein